MEENLLLATITLITLTSISLLAAFSRGVLRNRLLTVVWVRLVFGNFLVLLCLACVALLSGELYYRFICDTTDSLGYTKISKAWFQKYWHSNHNGCRDDIDYGLQIEPGKRRISFVGDSFTAGQGIKDTRDRFVNRIREAHPEWEVQMLAQPGFDTGNELEYVRDCAGQGYQLDQVVLVYCLNDVSDLFPVWTNAVARLGAEADEANWLVRNSYLLNTLYYRLVVLRNPSFRNYFDFVKEGYTGPIWETQKERLKEFRDLVRSHGGRLLVVTFPFFNGLGPDYSHKAAHEKLAGLWKELEVPNLDLLPAYEGFPWRSLTVNRFDSHPNERANEMAAEAIDKFLKAQMVIKPGE